MSKAAEFVGNNEFLDACAWHQPVERLHELLAKRGKKTSLQATDWKGWSPLHFEADAGRDHVISWLLDQGADCGAVDQLGQTPLFLAVRKNRLPAVKLLLQRGADVNRATSTSLMTPLHCAAFFHLDSVCQLLLDAGAEINAQTKLDETPLDLATSDDVRQLLTAKGGQLVRLPQQEAEWEEREQQFQREVERTNAEFEAQAAESRAANTAEWAAHRASQFRLISGKRALVDCRTTCLEPFGLVPFQRIDTKKGPGIVLGTDEQAGRLYAKLDQDSGVSFWTCKPEDQPKQVLKRWHIRPAHQKQQQNTKEQSDTVAVPISEESCPWVIKMQS